MAKFKHLNIVLSFSLSVLVAACGGGSDNPPADPPPPPPPSIVVSSCNSVAGDNTQNIDGSTSFTKSHLIGSPIYKLITTRKLTDNSDVTLDYMVHEPSTTPKGVIVLIAGGNLRARIQDTNNDAVPDNSSGNFVVRSAHRYQANGYRVITIDRPSDSVNISAAIFGAYGDSNVAINIDRYRHSMQHAVDIANILKLENTEGYNVIISGTSRGSISATAMNTLVTGIAMSSPLTSAPSTGGYVGYPIGSADLPLNLIKRPSHILLHSNDTCAYTLPADSRTLFNDLNTAGVDTKGNEVSGGFQDTVKNDVCGAFDFHGFNGIETCAVEKETKWADSIMADLASNSAPKANNLAVNEGDAITLTATDDNSDSLEYAVPYALTSLGGTVATDTSGAVTYTKPVGVTGTIDTFAYTVTDGNGGVSTAVVSITIP